MGQRFAGTRSSNGPQPERGAREITEKYATTNAGAPVPSVEHSLTVRPDGPILLQDHYLIEQMANFNRERIPGLRPDDDDWGQAGTLVREILDDESRDRLVHNIVGHVSDSVKEPVLSRVFEYWRNVDPDLGKKVEEGVRAELA